MTSTASTSAASFNSKWLLFGAAAGVATAALGYAIYFDYRRRNDIRFRVELERRRQEAMRNLAREEEERKKAAAAEAEKLARQPASEAAPAVNAGSDDLASIPPEVPREMYEFIDKVDLPLEDIIRMSPEDRQKVFYALLLKSEMLMNQKQPATNARAVDYFVKAAMLVPNPIEVIGAYKQTLPEAMYSEVINKFQKKNMDKAQAYFDELTAASPLVRFVLRETADGGIAQWGPQAAQDIPEGGVVLQEQPDVAIHASSEEGRCAQCHAKADALKPCVKCGQEAYCTEQCARDALSHHVFTCEARPEVKRAVQALKELAQRSGTVAPLLMLRYLSILLSEEISGRGADHGGPFMHYDHLRPVMKEPSEADRREVAAIKSVFALADENMVEFLKDEIYACMKATTMHNSLGLCAGAAASFPGGAKKLEPVRVAGSTAQSTIVGLYHTLSHVPHSCAPNCTVVLRGDACDAQLKALRPIPRGEPLTIAHAPVEDVPFEQRQAFLRKNFYLECHCSKCL